jgi:hypothetical protein
MTGIGERPSRWISGFGLAHEADALIHEPVHAAGVREPAGMGPIR